MGARGWHLKRSERHKEVADHLRDHGFTDWAAVALFYAAHQQAHSVLSGEPGLRKDERHPRKHTSHSDPGSGGRGTNQLVNALFPDDVATAYVSLFEASHRTRYDHEKLDSYPLLEFQYATVEKYCKRVNASREDISTQAP